MAKNHLIIFVCCLLFLFCACDYKVPYWNMVNGNLHYSKGDYTSATVSYMKALKKDKYTQWVNYNLGNTYNAMGEIDSAFKMFLNALEGKEPELLFRVNFNLGIIYSELGDFEKAVSYYKECLKAKPVSLDGKINLELAIRNYQSMLDAPVSSSANGNSSSFDQNWGDVMDSIRKEEERAWKVITQKQIIIDAEDW